MTESIHQMIERLRAEVREVRPEEVHEKKERGEPILLVDVREREEVLGGMLPGAVHVSRGRLEFQIERAIPDRGTPIVTYCAGGQRSLLAAASLLGLGYTDVASMSGGFAGWRERGFAVDAPRFLGEADRRRYARHLSIPEVGEEGQLKLLDARVLLIGGGGLGCPAALYLAAAGVGTLGIIDFDVVDETNLQRQVLYTSARIGAPKVEVATEALRGLNPGVRVVPIEERLTSANVERIFADYEIIIDGSDNFPTRYLVNDACVLLEKACVHGSVYRFEGQVTVFQPPEGPCYRCLYPEPPPAELAPSCAEAGVLGVLPGVVGLLEAIEAIKLILGAGRPLVGRLLTYDALGVEFRELKIRRDPRCRYCADGVEFPGFIDYEHFCSRGGGDRPAGH